MTHFVLRIGDLLHLHPFDRWLAERKVPGTEEPPPRIVEWRLATPPDDLAFFSLSVEEPVEDGCMDLEHVSLSGHEAPKAPAMDESWPPRL